MKTVFTFYLLVSCNIAFSQSQGNIWYFGNHSGINISKDSTITLIDGKTGQTGQKMEGSASMCDSDGRLLFYSNGEKIWSRNHQIMVNGDSILSSSSSTQSSLIVPQPGSNNLFYLFTTDAFYINNLKYGCRYSVVDMCLDDGLGAVVENKKNILLLDTVAEKLTAVKHANGVDYWILVHKYYSDAFYSFLLTSNGIVDTVITHIGSIHKRNCITESTASAIGYMKASPKGDKIALVCNNACSNNLKELFGFDNNTGEITNYINLQTAEDNTAGSGYYGVSFSANNDILYVTTSLGDILQYDLSGDKKDIINSKVVIPTLSANGRALQLGNDGKVYVALINTKYLGRINSPNSLGVNCNYVDNVIDLNNGLCGAGLPNFIDSYDYSNTIVDCETVINEGDDRNLTIPIYPNPTNIFFSIELPQQQGFTISIIDVTGRILYTNKNAIGTVKVDCSSFTSGVYFVKAMNEKMVLTGKFIKE